MAKAIRTIPEPSKTIPVVRECDVVVVGGAAIRREGPDKPKM